MTPKSTPKLSQKASRGPKMPFKTGPRFSIAFLTIFRAKTVTKIDPKITQKSTSAPQGLPEAAREPFWVHFEPFWSHFGPSGASFSKLSGHIVHYFSCFPARLFSCALLCCSPCLCCRLCALSSVAGSGAPAPVRSGHRASLNGLPL